jgi:hypothetical protein
MALGAAKPSPVDQCGSNYFRDYSDLNLNSSFKLAYGKEGMQERAIGVA